MRHVKTLWRGSPRAGADRPPSIGASRGGAAENPEESLRALPGGERAGQRQVGREHELDQTRAAQRFDRLDELLQADRLGHETVDTKVLRLQAPPGARPRRSRPTPGWTGSVRRRGARTAPAGRLSWAAPCPARSRPAPAFGAKMPSRRRKLRASSPSRTRLTRQWIFPCFRAWIVTRASSKLSSTNRISVGRPIGERLMVKVP